jgi:hypothetical protein
MPDDALPPASCSEPWAAVAGDESAHKFPAGCGVSLCGRHPADRATGPVSSLDPKLQAGADKLPHLPYCPRCRESNERRWLLAYPRGGVT